MNQKENAQSNERSEVASALDQLLARLPALTDLELVALWPALERKVLAQLRAEEHSEANLNGPLTGSETQRIRNLVWEIGVSVHLQSLHSRALATLAELMHVRAERQDARNAPSKTQLTSEARLSP
ncbi:MAG TPA: hypothetical protein VFK05_39175 [Polyangiaceae bacterium]|nr:hypothetical protein [Polyangiaceae bacterium]